MIKTSTKLKILRQVLEQLNQLRKEPYVIVRKDIDKILEKITSLIEVLYEDI